MFRLKKLLGILIVLGIVFFIICDEKGYKIKLENNRIAFEKIEEKPELVNEESLENVVYKNSDLVHLSILFKEKNFLRKSDGIDPEFFIVYKNSNRVHIYSGFENPINLRNSAGMDSEFLAKLEKEKAEAEARDESMKYKGPNIISMGEENDISDIIKSNKPQDIKVEYTGSSHDIILYKSKTEEEPNNKTVSLSPTQTGYFSPSIGDAIGMTWDADDFTGEGTKKEEKIESIEEKNEIKIGQVKPTEENIEKSRLVKIDRYIGSPHAINLYKSKYIESHDNEEILIIGEDLVENQYVQTGVEFVDEAETNEIIHENKGKMYNKSVINNYKNDKNNLFKSIESKNIITLQVLAKSMNIIKGGKYNKIILRDLKNKKFDIIKLQEPFENGRKTGSDEKNRDMDISEYMENVLNSKSNKDIEEIEDVEINKDIEEIEDVEINKDIEEIEDVEINKDVDEIEDLEINKDVDEIENVEIDNDVEETEDAVNTIIYKVEKYEGGSHKTSLSRGMLKLYKVEKYQLEKHNLNIKKGVKIEPEFIVPENLEEISYETGYTDNSILELENIISSDEIDINTLESENDEFLQAVFDKTKDTKVMNLIVETYLSEYQFVKAKKFIESLSGTYLDDLDPLLNLKVVFNSFALTSNTTDSTLTSMIEDYKSKNLISVEDRLWYLGVIALMQQNYDRFFELANDFSVVPHQNFAAKLQGYKDQIAKQMGMPDYYFDTLVSLELFNQGFFQPAKVLALYSLQQNSNYILPYQILAYANFLTNSWDTSIEYLKKLVDIDPTNAEKYRFLMGVAYYWDEKYQQSVVMLSLVKKESLRIDAERYLIRDYILLNQKTKLISIRNKLLGYDNLVASDFYTYFYEAFYRPFAEGSSYQIFAYDTELANKMIRVCSMKLSDEEKAVCNYGMIGKNVALGQYDGLEESLLKLAKEYPQGYLYQALGEYYIQKGDFEKAKVYLLKAVSMTKKTSEVVQIKKLLQNIME